MDDELLTMKCENKIKAFKRLFPGDGVYVWKNDRTDGFIQFKLISIKSNNLMDDDILTIYVELLDYKYQSVRKKLINQSVIRQFKHYVNGIDFSSFHYTMNGDKESNYYTNLFNNYYIREVYCD